MKLKIREYFSQTIFAYRHVTLQSVIDVIKAENLTVTNFDGGLVIHSKKRKIAILNEENQNKEIKNELLHN